MLSRVPLSLHQPSPSIATSCSDMVTPPSPSPSLSPSAPPSNPAANVTSSSHARVRSRWVGIAAGLTAASTDTRQKRSSYLSALTPSGLPILSSKSKSNASYVAGSGWQMADGRWRMTEGG